MSEVTPEQPTGDSTAPSDPTAVPSVLPYPAFSPAERAPVEGNPDEHVFSLAQAQALPVVDEGTPVTPLSPEELVKLWEKQGETNLQRLAPIVWFKNLERETMVVVRTIEGKLAAMFHRPAPDPVPAAPASAVTPEGDQGAAP